MAAYICSLLTIGLFRMFVLAYSGVSFYVYIGNSRCFVHLIYLLSTPMGVDYIVIGFDMEIQPLVTHNAYIQN